MSLSRAIQEAREGGRRIESIAAEACLSTAQIYRLMSDSDANPRLETILKLSRALGKPPSALFPALHELEAAA